MDGLKVPCPSCACPDQHVGLPCGFCGQGVPVPASAVTSGGTLRVEEVLGFRAWRVRRDPDGTPWLDSPVFPLRWNPGQWMIATCKGGHDDHTPEAADKKFWPPVKGCGGGGHGCGFYAGRSRQHLIQMHYARYTENDPHVIGQVQMAGKIIPASNGWRAQRVRPRVIYVPYELWELARDLREVYGPHGVEVDVSTTIMLPKNGADAIEWCAKCSAKMGRSATCAFCGYNHL